MPPIWGNKKKLTGSSSKVYRLRIPERPFIQHLTVNSLTFPLSLKLSAISYYAFAYPADTVHKGLEGRRNQDTAVGLLVILQKSHQGSAHSQSGSINGMDQFRFGPSLPAETDVGPAGLEIFKVAAGGYFPIKILSREPDFNIVGLGRSETEITGTETDHLIGQIQLFENLFGVLQQSFQFIIGIFRETKFYQFHFIKLVLADQPPGVLAV